jgi:hypothetical protein
MAFRRHSLALMAFALGLVGASACVAAIFGFWKVSERLVRIADAMFGEVDRSLIAIQERAERARARVESSAVSMRSISSSLTEWTTREAAQQLALQLDLAEKSDRLRVSMEQVDEWLKVARSTADLAQHTLAWGASIGAPVDAGFGSVLSDELASVQSQLAEATEFVEKFHERIAGVDEEELRQEHISRAVELALRAIATLSSIDARLTKFANRLSTTRENLEGLKVKTRTRIRVVAIAGSLLMAWMAIGQVALCRVAWTGLRSTPQTTAENRSLQARSGDIG